MKLTNTGHTGDSSDIELPAIPASTELISMNSTMLAESRATQDRQAQATASTMLSSITSL